MRSDQGRKPAGNGGPKTLEATVIELLPAAACRVELAGRGHAVAHAAGVRRTNFVRLRVGDRVLVELSPRDTTRARIVKLLGKG